MQDFVNSNPPEPHESVITVEIEPGEALQANSIPDLEVGVVQDKAVCPKVVPDSRVAGLFYVALVRVETQRHN